MNCKLIYILHYYPLTECDIIVRYTIQIKFFLHYAADKMQITYLNKVIGKVLYFKFSAVGNNQLGLVM